MELGPLVPSFCTYAGPISVLFAYFVPSVLCFDFVKQLPVLVFIKLKPDAPCIFVLKKRVDAGVSQESIECSPHYMLAE